MANTTTVSARGLTAHHPTPQTVSLPPHSSRPSPHVPPIPRVPLRPIHPLSPLGVSPPTSSGLLPHMGALHVSPVADTLHRINSSLCSTTVEKARRCGRAGAHAIVFEGGGRGMLLVTMHMDSRCLLISNRLTRALLLFVFQTIGR